MKQIKWLSVLLACLSMTIAPLVEAKQAEQQNLRRARQIIQEVGLGGGKKAKNLGEVLNLLKRLNPQVKFTRIERSLAHYKNFQAPVVTAQAVEGTNKADEIKLILTQGSETLTLEAPKGSGAGLKVNGILFTEAEILGQSRDQGSIKKILSIPYFRKVIAQKRKELSAGPILPTIGQLRAMSPIDLAHYKMHIAGLLVAAEAVQNSFLPKTATLDSGTSKYELFAQIMGINEAFAKGSPKTCVIGGYKAQYVTKGQSMYCSQAHIVNYLPKADQVPFKELQAICKGANQMACNSSFFPSNSGGAICVPVGRGPGKRDVTQACYESKETPKGQDLVKALLKQLRNEDVLDASGKALNPAALATIQSSLGTVVSDIEAMIEICKQPGGEPGQVTACEALEKQRAELALQMGLIEANPEEKGEEPPRAAPAAQTQPPPLAAPAAGVECPTANPCDDHKPGGVTGLGDGAVDKDKHNDGYLCKGYVSLCFTGAATVGIVGGLIWWYTRKPKDDTTNYIAPATTCPAGRSDCIEATPTVVAPPGAISITDDPTVVPVVTPESDKTSTTNSTTR